jgi:predicted metalloprotease with PDZ domain
MSYTRGELIALILDEALQARSDGALGLDDLMRDLAREAREAGVERPDVSRFYGWISEQADPALADEIRAYAEDGRPLELPRQVRAPALVLDETSGFYVRRE